MRPKLALGLSDNHISEPEDVPAPGNRRRIQRETVRGFSDPQGAHDLGERAAYVRAGTVGPANAQGFVQGAMPSLRKRFNAVTARLFFGTDLPGGQRVVQSAHT